MEEKSATESICIRVFGVTENNFKVIALGTAKVDRCTAVISALWVDKVVSDLPRPAKTGHTCERDAGLSNKGAFEDPAQRRNQQYRHQVTKSIVETITLTTSFDWIE